VTTIRSYDTNASERMTRVIQKPAPKRRGRPPKNIVREKEIISVIPGVDEIRNLKSVKQIPCCIAGCDHAYSRPGSGVVEQSDLPLPLAVKFGMYIRACKAHFKQWSKLPLGVRIVFHIADNNSYSRYVSCAKV